MLKNRQLRPKLLTLASCCLLAALGLAVALGRLAGGQDADSMAISVALDWYRYALQAERVTEGYRGPVAARMYGYAGLAAYEATVPFFKGEYQSLGPRFPHLHLPSADPGLSYSLPAVLNGCYATIFEQFFSTAPDGMAHSRRALFESWAQKCRLEADDATLERSLQFGKQVALAVFDWSATDSLGHQAHLHLFDRDYALPTGDDKWVPASTFPLPALLPHWGGARPFVIRPDAYLAKPYPEFSTLPNSVFYTQALEIFTLNNPLSSENLWIAEFWSDDQPGLTFTPSGRWISITNQVVEQEKPPLMKTIETYLKVGFALNDAIIAAWFSKYHYNLLRPETYIARVFDHHWHPPHHSPPFPSYPSGHAMIGAAVAETLTALYGQQFHLVDRSHAGRPEFKGMPRSFDSFYEMAFESALSRILLGVHFRMDCEEGTRLGLLLGKNIGSLNLRRGGELTLQ